MFVNIADGSHRNHPVSGVFAVAQAWKDGANGGFVTVHTDGKHPFTRDRSRIKVEDGGFVYCDSNGKTLDPKTIAHTSDIAARVAGAAEPVTDYETEFIQLETDDEAMTRIEQTFRMLEEVTAAATAGIVRGLVVSGPPGIGKSHGVEATLKKENMFLTLREEEPNYEVIGGSVGAVGLYKALYMNRKEGFVTVFDDCDNILYDQDTLNLLKNALDSKPIRKLSWLYESRTLREEDIPRNFEYEGSVIFLTNTDFDHVRSPKLKVHLDAMMSRIHYLDLGISSQRDQLLRIKQIVHSGMLRDFAFSQETEDTIVEYIIDNADYLRELSLRTVRKLADIVKMKPTGWETFTEATLLRREAKFKRLLDAKTEPQQELTDLEDAV